MDSKHRLEGPARARQSLPLSCLVTPFTTFMGDQAVQNREALMSPVSTEDRANCG